MRDTEIMAILHDHPPEHNLKDLAHQVFTERSLSGAHNGTEMC